MSSAANNFTELSRKPKLIVFDLDFTLWPFWVDTHVDAPFKKGKDGAVYDSRGTTVKYYEDVPSILSDLRQEGIQLAVASRTGAAEEAKSLLSIFGWNELFVAKEIYPGSKVTHFQRFHALTEIPYVDMLFFDDEHRNIIDTSKLDAIQGLTKAWVNDVKPETIAGFLAKTARHDSHIPPVPEKVRKAFENCTGRTAECSPN